MQGKGIGTSVRSSRQSVQNSVMVVSLVAARTWGAAEGRTELRWGSSPPMQAFIAQETAYSRFSNPKANIPAKTLQTDQVQYNCSKGYIMHAALSLRQLHFRRCTCRNILFVKRCGSYSAKQHICSYSRLTSVDARGGSKLSAIAAQQMNLKPFI